MTAIVSGQESAAGSNVERLVDDDAGGSSVRRERHE